MWHIMLSKAMLEKLFKINSTIFWGVMPCSPVQVQSDYMCHTSENIILQDRCYQNLKSNIIILCGDAALPRINRSVKLQMKKSKLLCFLIFLLRNKEVEGEHLLNYNGVKPYMIIIIIVTIAIT
jgi:hypothetical protein